MTTTTLSGSLTATVPASLTVQQWWDQAAPMGEEFFSAVGQFMADTPHDTLCALLDGLHCTRQAYASLGFPAAARDAHAHLGAAMDHLLASFEHVLADEIGVAQAYLQAGQTALSALAVALDAIGAR